MQILLFLCLEVKYIFFTFWLRRETNVEFIQFCKAQDYEPDYLNVGFRPIHINSFASSLMENVKAE